MEFIGIFRASSPSSSDAATTCWGYFWGYHVNLKLPYPQLAYFSLRNQRKLLIDRLLEVVCESEIGLEVT